MAEHRFAVGAGQTVQLRFDRGRNVDAVGKYGRVGRGTLRHIGGSGLADFAPVGRLPAAPDSGQIGIHSVDLLLRGGEFSAEGQGRTAELLKIFRSFRLGPGGDSALVAGVGIDIQPRRPVVVGSPGGRGVRTLRRGEKITVVVSVHVHVQTQLLEVVDAGDGLRFRPRLVQCRKQHGGENGDDRYFVYLRK